MCNLSWTPHSNLEKDNSLKTTPVLAQRWAVWSILTKNIDWLLTDLRFMLRARLLISLSDGWSCGRAFALHPWRHAIEALSMQSFFFLLIIIVSERLILCVTFRIDVRCIQYCFTQ